MQGFTRGRRWLGAAALAVAMAAGGPARAEFPERNITILSGFAAGGGGDVIIRYYAKKLQELSGATFIVENRQGANGHIGTQELINADPDGYTMLIHGASAVVGNTFQMKAADYDPLTDLTTISVLFELGVALVTGAKNDIETVADLVGFLKKEDGEADYGIQNISNLVSTALFLQATGTKGVEVNYKTSQQATDDMAAGLIDFGFNDTPSSLARAKQGQIKVLAVTTKERAPAAPDVPTMMEAGVPGYEYSVVWSAWFPKDTPAEIVAEVNGWFTKVNQDPETVKFLENLGAAAVITATPQAAADRMKAFYDQWSGIISGLDIEKQ